MMNFQQETLYMLIGEIENLIQLHYEEVTLHKEFMELDVDWAKYAELERQGKLLVFTARDHGVLVGYSAFFIDNHIHYKTNVMATNDAVFLHPDHRKGSMAIKLIKFCDSELSKLGPVKITWHVKFSRDFRAILHRLGYIDEEVICGKIAGVNP